VHRRSRLSTASLWIRGSAVVALLVVVGAVPRGAQPAAQPSWIARSNENAQILLNAQSAYNPEGAARQGLPGFDEQVLQLPKDRRERMKADLEKALRELQRRRSVEKDPLVAQDLDILIKAVQESLRGQELGQRYQIPYFNVASIVFNGIRGLLDDQVPPERRQAALVRLRKYAGVEPGYAPLTEQAKARTGDWMRPGQAGPPKIELESDLARANFFLGGIGELFAEYKIAGYQEALGRLKEQIAEYNAWVTKEILPKSRTDFRRPPEQYAFSLQQFGVDIPPAQLTAMAHKAFDQWQAEMQDIARQVAKARGLASNDYRDVIRELKKDQLVGAAILPHYQQRLKDIEQIIERERLVSLPARPARIRLATAAETAQQPAPHMVPAPLLNNTGQQGEFVLPLNVPTRPGSAETVQTDDFTFAAASWTLTAHEARPGHELQFATMVERGVSLARAMFAFNSVNVEGWGLYAEHIMKPFEPLEGQLISLQLRLMRAARAFIDPELQSGALAPADAMRILTNDVVLSEAFANTEVERYTFRAPGQATSYFYGYMRLLDLRRDVEAKLGSRFDQRQYHDFLLAQGLLPPDLLRNAVVNDFVNK
jgi:Bacterial protein of unknown function (DUF885)